MILKLDTIFYFLRILRIIHIQYIIAKIVIGNDQGSTSFMYCNNCELYRSDYKYNISTIKLRVDSSSMDENPHRYRPNRGILSPQVQQFLYYPITHVYHSFWYLVFHTGIYRHNDDKFFSVWVWRI